MQIEAPKMKPPAAESQWIPVDLNDLHYGLHGPPLLPTVPDDHLRLLPVEKTVHKGSLP